MKSLFIKSLLGVAVVISTLSFTEKAEARCFIFVHGHSSSPLYPSWSQARAYWKNGTSTDMAGYVGANNKYVIINYNTGIPYWDGAKEVAGKINTVLNGGNDGGGLNCSGQTSYMVIAHSMGNAVMDFILGNTRSADPYYNYGGANFANIGAKVSTFGAVQGAHRGTEAANSVCGSSSFLCNTAGWIAGIVGNTCDAGTASLQTASSQTVNTYTNSPSVSTYVIGSWKGMVTSGCLTGEDDGVIQYASLFACSGSATASYSTTNVCTSKQKPSGFYQGDQSYEDHDTARKHSSQAERRSVYGGLWGSISTNTKVRSSMSTAELIRCVWAQNRPSGDTACN